MPDRLATPETTAPPQWSGGPAPQLHALVPCAGTGTRAGGAGPKQYALLATRPLVWHTLAALEQVARLSSVTVVLSPDDVQFRQLMPGWEGDGHWLEHCGGETRAQTVANGLQALLERGAQAHDWVLVHDAARCLIRPGWVDRLIDACGDDEVGGILAMPVADTLKRERDGRVEGTVDRRHLWAAQTPQMFRLGLLRPALAHAGDEVTDESSAVEALGHSPKVVRGDAANLKITYPGDFVLAERLMQMGLTR